MFLTSESFWYEHMGNIINFSNLCETSCASAFMLPLIFVKRFSPNAHIVSVGIPMAQMLIEMKANRRAQFMERCLLKILQTSPEHCLIRDFDLMFNPFYQIDVLKIMISACKIRPFSILWPGIYRSGKLIYANEGDLDYCVFNVQNYDITCVI